MTLEDHRPAAEPNVTLQLPLSSAINLEAELLARFSQTRVQRSLWLRQAGIVFASIIMVGLLVFAGALWRGGYHREAGQFAAMLAILVPMTIDRYIEVARFKAARREIAHRRGL